jgi:hypothetical protein
MILFLTSAVEASNPRRSCDAKEGREIKKKLAQMFRYVIAFTTFLLPHV